MDIKKLIAIIKKKIENEIAVENLKIEDKSFLHKNHPGNEKNRYHLKISIESDELKKMSKIESNKKIYRILNEEMKMFIHSIQILLN
jgi:BolA family transcriptional regulator, general stress-responsive regulator